MFAACNNAVCIACLAEIKDSLIEICGFVWYSFRIQDLFTLGRFINALEDGLGVRVDMLTYDALRDSVHSVIETIDDEVVLYEG